MTTDVLDAGPAVAKLVKATICSIIAALPCCCWSSASAIVRTIWPGFSRA